MAQTGVAVEGDAVHLPRLTLVPVGTGVDRDPAGDREIVVGKVDLQGDAEAVDDVVDPSEDLEAGLAAGDTLLDGRVDLGGLVVAELEVDLGVHVATERRRHPVDGRQEVEVLEAEPGVEVLARGDPGVAGDADPQIVAGRQVGADEAVAEFALERREQTFAGLVGLDDLSLFFDGGFSR